MGVLLIPLGPSVCHGLTAEGVVSTLAIVILVVDDHPHFREAVRTLLAGEADMSIVAEAVDGESAVSLAEKFAPDVVLMDIVLPGISGIEATRRIKAAQPKCAVLAITLHSQPHLIEQVLEAGAGGYLSKDTPGHQLVSAIRTAAAGGSYISAASN